MRKKEYLSELKAKIQQLEDEKEQLTKENMNYKLNNNNHNNTPAVDPNVANAISGTCLNYIICLLYINYISYCFTNSYYQRLLVCSQKCKRHST